MDGTWFLLVGEQEYDPATNARVTFTADGRATIDRDGETVGRWQVENGLMRADFARDHDDGTSYEAIIVTNDSGRAAALSGSIYYSSTGIPTGIGDNADPFDEGADDLMCDPCVLFRADAE